MSRFSDDQFGRSTLSINEALQAVEDALIELGFDNYVFATERGTFRWQTIERAITEASDQSG
ncbi:MAG TPA: hypothetical protein VKV77_01850 [Methylovirgula sp.]|nr:hypothetical protein [Methylovirgula sp.]